MASMLLMDVSRAIQYSILTGTPEGVGFTRKPPVYLKPGDVVEIKLEGMETLRNSVVSEN